MASTNSKTCQPANTARGRSFGSRVPDQVQTVNVIGNNTVIVDFQIQLGGVQEEVTITATGTEQAASSSIQSVDVIGSVDLAKKSPVSLGESLDGELGVSKRSFGPGTARPVIRGFDGDRVLILADGNRIGWTRLRVRRLCRTHRRAKRGTHRNRQRPRHPALRK